jgi:hypothetical protein
MFDSNLNMVAVGSGHTAAAHLPLGIDFEKKNRY